MLNKIENVLSEIKECCLQNDIDFNRIKIVVATKTQSIETLNSLSKYGLNIVGENKTQELLDKYDEVKGLEWHFIGQLQSNKVKSIVDKVSLIQSVDRLSLASEIDSRCKKINKIMDILVEVNIGMEESKGGVKPDEITELIDKIKNLGNIRLRGLMTVMPKNASDNYYIKMRTIYYDIKRRYPNLAIDYLSMGMSDDYIKSLKFGANMIRLGRAFFGDRGGND